MHTCHQPTHPNHDLTQLGGTLASPRSTRGLKSTRMTKHYSKVQLTRSYNQHKGRESTQSQLRSSYSITLNSWG